MLTTLGLMACPSFKATAQPVDSPADVTIDSAVPAGAIQWTSGPGANGHFYFLTPTTSSWVTSEAEAVTLGGHLASITSAAEESFLITNFLVDSSSVATKPLWIGLTDATSGLGSKNYSTWTTGEAVTYTDWNDPTEPNNLNGSEDYVALNWHYSFGETGVKGTWDDLPLNGSTANYGGNNARALGPYYGIVEVVPEPATNALLGVGMVLGLGSLWRRKAGKFA